MLNLKSLGVVALMGLLAGCTTNIQAMKAVEATGSPFTKALAEEYRQIVTFEADEMYDWPDADYFAQKGLKAAAGEVVQPEELANWDLPAEWAGDLAEGRNRLMVALESGARAGSDRFRPARRPGARRRLRARPPADRSTPGKRPGRGPGPPATRRRPSWPGPRARPTAGVRSHPRRTRMRRRGA